ncbi:MAG TPA: hypothetical protein VGM88_15650 [Kofleriaceae bacterium]|jgi:hypothetical protein
MRAVVLVCLALSAACGSGTSSREGDAPLEDAHPLPMPDSMLDAAPDAMLDAAPDTAIDAAPDATVDAAPDATIDAAIDAAVPDAPAIDAAPDAAPPDSPPPSDAPAIDAPPPPYTISGTTFDLGVLPGGEFDPYPVTRVTITNTGTTTLDVAASITGWLEFYDASTFTIAPGGTGRVSFYPDTKHAPFGPFAASVTIDVDGALTVVTVSGTVESTFEVGVVRNILTGGITADFDVPGTTPCSPPPRGWRCAPIGTTVVATAELTAPEEIVAWYAPGGCALGPSCSFTGGATPLVINAASDHDYTWTTVDLAVAGAGADDIEIDHDTGVVEYCNGACSITVRSDEPYELYAQSPDSSGTFDGPCNEPDECMLTGDPSATVTATFTHEAGELATQFAGQAYSVDFDAAGDLLVGTATGVYALAPDLTMLWTSPAPGFARWDSLGDAFVVDATTTTKLDSTGATLWTAPIGEPLPGTGAWPDGPRFATTLTGGIVLSNDDHIDIYDATGVLVAHVPDASTQHRGGPWAIAVAPDDGTIYVAIDDDSEIPDTCQVQLFDPTGVAFPSLGLPYGFTALNCNIAVNADRIVLGGGEGGYDAWGEVEDRAFTPLVGADENYPNDIYELSRHVAVGGPDVSAVEIYPLTNDDLTHAYGIELWKYDATSALAWHFTAPPRLIDGFWNMYTGTLVRDIAVGPSGQIAVAGAFLRNYDNPAFAPGVALVYP